jgi:hypothetical protein
MQTHNLPRSVARILVLAMLENQPKDNYYLWPFDGGELDQEGFEFEVVFVKRRKRKDTPIQTIPAFIALTPPMVYE